MRIRDIFEANIVCFDSISSRAERNIPYVSAPLPPKAYHFFVISSSSTG